MQWSHSLRVRLVRSWLQSTDKQLSIIDLSISQSVTVSNSAIYRLTKRNTESCTLHAVWVRPSIVALLDICKSKFKTEKQGLQPAKNRFFGFEKTPGYPVSVKTGLETLVTAMRFAVEDKHVVKWMWVCNSFFSKRLHTMLFCQKLRCWWLKTRIKKISARSLILVASVSVQSTITQRRVSVSMMPHCSLLSFSPLNLLRDVQF